MTRAFVIDTDTASDDAVALIMALRWPDVDVKAITVVAGNVPVEQATNNALYTVELSGNDVPVYMGASKPLTRIYEDAQWFHGKDGLGDQGYPAPTRQAEAKHAVDALIDTIKANPGIVLVTLGPLTNVALAVSRAPEIVPLVSRCVVMGGAACTVGNVTPAAEYNIWVDPEAARIVFLSGLPIEMVGWELCRGDANLRENDIKYVRSLDTALAHFTIDCNSVAMNSNFVQSNELGIALPDPVTMAVALDPEGVVTKASKHYVEIECVSDLTRGMTVVDQLDVTHDERNQRQWAQAYQKPKNATVVWEINIARWKEILFSVLK
ncbi:MAG: nucleoside hydrolase [Anaerolineae bacterium]|nr:nucleoside hydrolase [Anaerolineae bacterium]MBN8618904.1 nucleoside hydrolase [Anaerolineae bacterium]